MGQGIFKQELLSAFILNLKYEVLVIFHKKVILN